VNLLKRSLAPILPQAWEAIDAQAAQVLRLNLAGRKLVDFHGPHGLTFAAVNTGRLRLFPESLPGGVRAGVREVVPLIELRTPLRLSIFELDTLARGGTAPSLEPLVDAAERTAEAEDAAIFHGLPDAGIVGLVPSSPHEPREFGEPAELPRALLEAVEVLRRAGVGGPYALALSTPDYETLFAATEDGYPIVKRIRGQLIDGPIVQAPVLERSVVVSQRGGDYELTVGQDFAIGYEFHEKDQVQLYLTESFTFRVLEPAAAVALRRT
jgi:uncharacterized linocin/CFP29 family protein